LKVPRAPSLFFIFYAPGPILGSIDGIWSCFIFAHPDSFWAVSRVRGTVLLFCAPRLLLGVTEGVGSCFHVLHSRTHFRRYRGRGVPFLCFALPVPFWAVPRTSGLIFMFYAPRLFFGGTEGADVNIYISRPWTRFRRYRGRRVPFSCFALTESFWALPSASGLIFMFCAPEPV
jgi:hypothetical protein